MDFPWRFGSEIFEGGPRQSNGLGPTYSSWKGSGLRSSTARRRAGHELVAEPDSLAVPAPRRGQQRPQPSCQPAQAQMRNLGNFSSIFVSSPSRTEVLQPK